MTMFGRLMKRVSVMIKDFLDERTRQKHERLNRRLEDIIRQLTDSDFKYVGNRFGRVKTNRRRRWDDT